MKLVGWDVINLLRRPLGFTWFDQEINRIIFSVNLFLHIAVHFFLLFYYLKKKLIRTRINKGQCYFCVKRLSYSYPDYNSVPDILVYSQDNVLCLCHIVVLGSSQDIASYSLHRRACNLCTLWTIRFYRIILSFWDRKLILFKLFFKENSMSLNFFYYR